MSDVRDGMLAILPKHLVPSLGKLSRMETGATASLDTLVLFAMARVLGCGRRELLVLFGVITVEAKTTTDVFGMAAGLA